MDNTLKRSKLKNYHLRNLDCANCAAKIEQGIKRVPGVHFANLNFATATLRLQADDPGQVRQKVKEIEPDVEMVEYDTTKSFDTSWITSELLIIGVSSLLFVLGLIFLPFLKNTYLSLGEYLVFGTAYLLSGWGVLRDAARKIKQGSFFDETFLMSIATLGAIAINEIPEAVGVMLFYKTGEYLQHIAINRSRRSIQALLEVRPKFANLMIDGEVQKVDPQKIKVGDSIFVRPGEKIPLDGVVLEGVSNVDTAALTGESIPRLLQLDDEALAGMIIQDGVLVLEVTRLYQDSTVSKMLDLVQNAAQNKARTEKFITRFAQIYTPVVVVIAAAIAFLPPLLIPGQELGLWVHRALVLLVISCPCALMVSIPLGYFGGLGSASRKGILIKGANYLDVLAETKTVIFDKTGTLTQGTFRVTDIQPANGLNKEQLLRYAALAEAHSNHPIAVSIRHAYGSPVQSQEAQNHKEIIGQGIRVQVNGNEVLVGSDSLMHNNQIQHETCEVPGTAIHIALDGEYAGYLVVADEIKEDAVQVVEELHAIGVEEVIMLTGDRRDVAEAIAESLGIDRVHAELMPEDKLHLVEEILENQISGKVAFVGDGINDAPALARADVGLAMGGLGADAAIETADVAIMSDSPSKVAEAILLGRRTRRIVWQNIGLAFLVKGAFIILGIVGGASMWQAVFADVGVTILAVLNSTRVMK